MRALPWARGSSNSLSWASFCATRLATGLSSFPSCFLAVAVTLIVQAKVRHNVLKIEDRLISGVNSLHERRDSIGFLHPREGLINGLSKVVGLRPTGGPSESIEAGFYLRGQPNCRGHGYTSKSEYNEYKYSTPAMPGKE